MAGASAKDAPGTACSVRSAANVFANELDGSSWTSGCLMDVLLRNWRLGGPEKNLMDWLI
jgi:hypothetical protein